MIIVRITGCRDPLRWYADMAGSYVPLVGVTQDGIWKSIEPDGFVNFVLPEDSQPIELRPSEPDRELTTDEALDILRSMRGA